MEKSEILHKQKQKFQEIVNHSLNERIRSQRETTMPKKISYEIPIEFKCECSNPDCQDELLLSIDKYKRFHRKPNHFLVKKGHEKPDIEIVIREVGAYLLVEKPNFLVNL